MRAFLSNCDAILSPVAARPAVLHGTSPNDDIFPGFSYTMTHNLTGWPAAVVRYGESADGLPINVQIAAAPWREDIAMSLVIELEQASGGGWVYSELHRFTGGEDGYGPHSRVLIDTVGNLYGTASGGGQDAHGVIWRIVP